MTQKPQHEHDVCILHELYWTHQLVNLKTVHHLKVQYMHRLKHMHTWAEIKS